MIKGLFMNKFRNVSDDSGLTEQKVRNSVKYLRKAFMNACYAYKDSHEKAVMYVLRDKKTFGPLPEYASADLTIYNAQFDFAYIMNDIEEDVKYNQFFMLHSHIKKCNELIDSLTATV